jgi:outer membrane protein assembly factor BamB/outer membrane biosynthesis protein TonB
MISAQQLLDVLEKKSLLLPKQAETLRKQLAQAGASVTAAMLAKRLVEKGLLSAEQVKHALGETSEPGAPAAGEMKRLPHGSPRDSHGKPAEHADNPSGERSLRDVADSGPVVINPTGESDDIFKVADDEPPETPPAKPEPAKAPEPAPQAKPSKPAPVAKPAPAKPAAKSEPATPSAKKPVPAEPIPKKPKLAMPKVASGGGVNKRRLALFGGIGVAVLAIAGAVIWIATRPTGEQELRAADDAFSAGNLARAAEAYDEFLATAPRHAKAGQARVRRGLSRLRLAIKGSPNWPEAARLAAAIVPEIAPEPAVQEVRKDLGEILTAIAGGMVGRVRHKPDSSSITQAQQVLAMIVRYVPRSLRDRTAMTDHEITLGLAQRQIDRESELGKTIAAMRQASSQGKPQEVYAQRTALVTAYPDLVEQASLRDALQAAAQSEKTAVKKGDRKQPSVREEVASSVVAGITFAARYPRSDSPGVAGRVLTTFVNGAAYGLDAASGKVLWRRFVGLDDPARTKLEPMTTVSDGKAAILLDTIRNEVVCIEAATGRLRWRHPLGEEPGARPTTAGAQVFVPLRSGRLLAIDLASGDSAGTIQFPQPLRVSPAADPRSPLIYQLGEQQNLYVVSVPDGVCKQVVALEHAPASAAVTPTVVGRLLLVVVNDRLMESTLHVLTINAEDPSPLVPRQQIRLHGHVDVPPHAADGRVAIATDCGAVYLFEIVEKNTSQPLKQIAAASPSGPEDLVRFAVLADGRLWVAGEQLTAYEPAAEGQIKSAAQSCTQSTFQQPIVAAGKVLFHARHRNGFSDVLVTATNLADGKTCWETRVGSPLADLQTDAQGSRVVVATEGGAVFQIDAQKTTGTVIVDQPLAATPTDQLAVPIAALVQAEGGSLMLVGGSQSQQVFIVDPSNPQKAILPSPLPDTAAGAPIGFAGGLLVPGQSGQITLWDPAKNKSLGNPFFPPSRGGRWAWTTPVAAGEGRVIVADDRRQLRLIEWQREKRQLVQLAQAVVPADLVSMLALAGDKVFYAVDATSTLAAFKLPELQRGTTWPLEDGCTWGPWSAGDRVLLASGARKFRCLDAGQKLLWQAEYAFGQPVGKPCRTGSNFLLAFAGGVVCRIDGASGKELGNLDVGQALAAGPTIVGTRLFVGTPDGSLLEIKQP